MSEGSILSTFIQVLNFQVNDKMPTQSIYNNNFSLTHIDFVFPQMMTSNSPSNWTWALTDFFFYQHPVHHTKKFFVKWTPSILTRWPDQWKQFLIFNSLLGKFALCRTLISEEYDSYLVYRMSHKYHWWNHLKILFYVCTWFKSHWHKRAIKTKDLQTRTFVSNFVMLEPDTMLKFWEGTHCLWYNELSPFQHDNWLEECCWYK